MLPFLAKDMFDLVFNLLKRFVKEDVLEKVTLTVKLVQLDLTNSSLHKDTLAVDIGFVANKLLHNLKQTHTKKISDKDFYSVKADTKTLLIAVVKKLLLKVPIRYGLMRNLTWLHPLAICGNQDRCLQHLNRCLMIKSPGNIKSLPEGTQPIPIFSPSLLVSHTWMSFFMTAWPMLLSGLICGI